MHLEPYKQLAVLGPLQSSELLCNQLLKGTQPHALFNPEGHSAGVEVGLHCL